MTPPPVLAGALHEIVTCAFPGVAANPVGAPGVARIAKETLEEVAAVKPPVSVIVAETEHVPVLRNATAPVLALIVQTDEVLVA